MENLTPRQIVAELNKYIVGQDAAKRAVAVALRNRYRRRLLPDSIQGEISPKNLLMIGPTGVGKTEIARRVAKLIDAPFVKVEATKFTEVGYVGRDVDSIVQELVEASVAMVHAQKLEQVQAKAESTATERILDYLCQQTKLVSQRARVKGQPVAAQAARGNAATPAAVASASSAESEVTLATVPRAGKGTRGRQRERLIDLLASHQLEDVMIDIELSSDADNFDSVVEFAGGMSPEEMTETFNEFMQSYSSYTRKRVRRVSVREARRLLTREEANKLIDLDQVVEEGVQRAEQSGVVFIDELDKICGPKVEMGADVSGEGVQRDLLPIVEGTTVMTRYGQVKTDHILFLAAGAFHHSKPSDLIPELQGRFPLRVELNSLGQADFERILTEPDNALTKQYQALLSTEGVELEFTPDGISEIARMAHMANEQMENIGARRLHTVLEKVLEDVSFEASDHQGKKVVVDAAFVQSRLGSLVQNQDLSRYIL